MFRRNVIPLWVAIILVASMYLMGQGWSPETGPPAPVPKTGQTTSYATGDDGDLEKGVAWPVPRFTDNLDGTVTDNLTGLIWTKNANCDGAKTWVDALSYCNALADGTCGLTDGSIAGDWRLANRLELESLVDMENYTPALPTGHPFTDVQLDQAYWSSTTVAASAPDNAFIVGFGSGGGNQSGKSDLDFREVWCVRGGQ